jgi:YD repeat-containing protein
MPQGSGTSSTSDYQELSYDANSNVTSIRMRRGETIAFTHDALNHLILKDVPTRSGLAATHTRDVYYGHDLFGDQLYARFDSASGEGISNSFDALGRPTQTMTDMDGISRTLGYQYDVAGNLVRVTHPDGVYFSYNRNGVGVLDTIDLNGTSPLIGLSFDSAGRLSAIKRCNTGTADWGQSNSATYDALSQIMNLVIDPAGTSHDVATDFTYNPASQFHSADRDNEDYVWDGSVDVTRSYTANGRNQYTAVAGNSFAYDANGNLSSDGTDGAGLQKARGSPEC